MQFLYNKNLGKIWCSAVLKALTSNKDIRIELHRENSYNVPTKSRFSLPMRCIFRYKMCGEFLKYTSTAKEIRPRNLPLGFRGCI